MTCFGSVPRLFNGEEQKLKGCFSCSQLPCALRGTHRPLLLLSFSGVAEVYLGGGADAGHHASPPLPAPPPAAPPGRPSVDPACQRLGPHLHSWYDARPGADPSNPLMAAIRVLLFQQRRRGSRGGTSGCHTPKVAALRVGAGIKVSWGNSWPKDSYLWSSSKLTSPS